jgi:hypothetical protein
MIKEQDEAIQRIDSNIEDVDLNVSQAHTELLKYFQLVCVDDKVKELANKGLKIVPTIIVKGFSKPIEGKNVFNWLETTLSMRSNKQIDNSNEVRRNCSCMHRP